MAKPLYFIGLAHIGPTQMFHGLWRHDACETVHFNDIEFWEKTSRQLEEGLFDGLFFVDSPGLHGLHNGNHATHVREGAQFPKNDPSVLISALAASTEHLGFAFTSSIVQEHPFMLARRLSTLDHATHGRVAWNIVTGSNANAVRNLGYDELTAHDERYRWAEEYVEVTYKLWEGSHDDDALVLDRATGVVCDPAKVHKIHHVGERYRVEGPHLVTPSLQRTPLLFQAGTSSAGRAFAAKHAECVFLVSGTRERARSDIEDTRRRAVQSGRRGDDIKFFNGLSFVVASSEREAREKEEHLLSKLSVDGVLAHFGGNLGVDLGGLDLDQPLDLIPNDAMRSVATTLKSVTRRERPTVRDVTALPRMTTVVGTPEMIADELAGWQEAGIDGVQVAYHTLPGSYDDFIDHVMPVLRARGLARKEPSRGTFRKKFFDDDQVNQRHPASRFRGAFTDDQFAL